MIGKKITAAAIALTLPFFLLAQTPDTMKVSLKDSVTTHIDCMLKVEVSRKDGTPFIFPSNLMIQRDIPGIFDLIIILEKKIEGQYKPYECKWLSAHNLGLDADPIKYEKYTRLTFTDSLNRLGCVDSGQFRVKLDYNIRPADGSYAEPTIALSSNWAYFFVKSDMIYLNARWREMMKEHSK